MIFNLHNSRHFVDTSFRFDERLYKLLKSHSITTLRESDILNSPPLISLLVSFLPNPEYRLGLETYEFNVTLEGILESSHRSIKASSKYNYLMSKMFEFIDSMVNTSGYYFRRMFVLEFIDSFSRLIKSGNRSILNYLLVKRFDNGLPKLCYVVHNLKL